MKWMAAVMFSVVSLALVGCGGGNSSAGTVSGNWSANLANDDGTPAFTLTTSLMQSSNTLVTGSNLVFTTSTACFTSGGSQTGSVVLNRHVNGNVSGAFQLTITSGMPPGTTLALTGTVNGNTITRMWTLTGAGGCTGTGNFTMTKM